MEWRRKSPEGRRKCRIWWPSNLSSQTPDSSCFLFGWFIASSEGAVDVVVAFSCDESSISPSIDFQLDLQEILRGINKNIPSLLHDKCKFSLLGYYEREAEFSTNGQLVKSRNGNNGHINTGDGIHISTCTSNYGSWNCGCPELHGSLEQVRLLALDSMWIKLVDGISVNTPRRVHTIPKFDHLHWNGETMSQLDLHHLFNPETFCKKPKWFDDLHQIELHIDLDTVVRAINTAYAAQLLFDGHCHAEPESNLAFHIVCMLTTFCWELFAVAVASVSTLVYVILQSSHVLFSWLSHSNIFVLVAKVFGNTRENIHVHCCQLLYWPFFLQDRSLRCWSCVEFAEKAALRNHSVWFNVVIDILLGFFLGIALWYNAEPVCLWVSNFSLDITNYWLRTSCVWLMGNPAGFKVNTELAGVLGMISLTAIQIWSTLWAYMGFLLIHFIKGLALSSILFGLTTAGALVIDVVSLVSMHISTLHLFLSLLYSTQIQSVASLWRLFSGRKWNPLRQRLDSYDYSVEQHVVGSLLFTPIFLLLPTTSAFYIFFTIVRSAICFICIVIEVAIAFIHATPYAKVIIWLKNKKRFPSGIWFEVVQCQHSETIATNDNNSSRGKLQKVTYGSSSEHTVLISFLHSNYLTLGEVVWPHYRSLFSTFSRSSIGSSAYGILSGRSIPCSLGVNLPPKLPWIVIPWKEYWRLCYDSVYMCRRDLYSQIH